MFTPTAISDILIIVNKLKNGVNIHKCKVDGKMMQIQSGLMQAEDSLAAVKITCTVTDGQQTTNIEAHHTLAGDHDVIKLGGADGAAGEEPDIDMRIIPHLISADVKATLQFHQSGSPRTIELYGKIAGV